MFATPQRPNSQPQQSTPVSQVTPGPETPKVGGKWIHPALPGIENEARKAMFGEEELKRLVLNTSLLYAMWWFSAKIEERYYFFFQVDGSDIFESLVRFMRHSPKLALGLQIISWTFRGLFLFNILQSVLPLLRPKSRPLTTIPLTPAQRELIGLDNAGITSRKLTLQT
jgi:Nuclear pore complex component